MTFDVLTGINLRDADSSGLELIYYPDPSIQVDTTFGESVLQCDVYPIVVEQLKTYQIPVEIGQVYDFYNGSSFCPIDSGRIELLFDYGNGEQILEFRLEGYNGTINIPFVPGEPNILAPYTRKLELRLYPYDRVEDVVVETLDVLVLGDKADESTFTTTSPEIPMLILRDPPGDGSFASFTESTSSCHTLGFSAQVDASVNKWTELKLGTKFEAGLGFSTETKVWGTVNGSMEVGATTITTNEQEVCLEALSTYETSQSLQGKDGICI